MAANQESNADMTAHQESNANDKVSEIDEQSCSFVGKKKIRNKEDKAWTDYDELLINAVIKRLCLWNHITPPKTRGPLTVKEAWLEVKKELDSNIYFNI